MKFDYQTYIHAKSNIFATFFTTVELVSFYSHMMTLSNLYPCKE